MGTNIAKWVAGIAASVLAAVTIYWLTSPGGLLNPTPTPPPVMNVSGVWLTPFSDLSYDMSQDDTKVLWRIRESGVIGESSVVGRTLVGKLDGREVTYQVGVSDAQGQPTVLWTVDPQYVGVILFRGCGDFGSFVSQLASVSPQWRTMVEGALKAVANPTCPGVLGWAGG